MRRHYTKNDFPALGLTVIVMEVLAFLILVVGLFLSMGGSVYGFDGWSLILISMSVLLLAFFIFAFGELVQLFMKIEVNTRKTEAEMNKILKDVEKKMAMDVGNKKETRGRPKGSTKKSSNKKTTSRKKTTTKKNTARKK